ncbi:MAG: nucleotidyltransferase family protein [bacterium]
MKTTSHAIIAKEEIIEFLQKNKPFLKENFGLTKIALFGSHARNEQTVESDIDLAIETSNVSFKNYCKLKNFLESNLNKKIDLCYLNSMRTFIKHSIEKEIIYA